MADAALSGLVSDVLRSLASIAFQEIGRLRSLEADVSALKDTYTQIQAVLNDAEVKQSKEKSVETWLKSLRSASLEVENILDDFLTDDMLQRIHNRIRNGTKYKVRAFFSSDHNPLFVRTRVANKVKTIRRRLDRIAANKSQFNLISDAVSVDAMEYGRDAEMETTSLMSTFMVYGRDAEMEMVVQKICSKDIVKHDTEGVQVYAIWGMGGVGKTTLAQLVYNHERVRAQFELQSWVYVSNDFHVKRLTRGIIESIDKRKCELSQLEAMQMDLQDKLKGKRFFIVLDDVWIEERIKWDELSKVLNCGAEGSIVMVTTRNETTSRMMAAVPEFQHQVGCLSEEESWLLFKKLAFASGNGSEPENITELESIGKEIVNKCKGLPLALKTLGGLIWSKNSASAWQSVKDSDVWELQENGILPALKLSYDSLLPHMKRCFAYCCLFPKGYEMKKDLLIELWMANGFIPPRGQADLYVIGEEIFYYLVSRSFLQDLRQDLFSLDIVCKMHDLILDFGRYVMRHDYSFIEPGKKLITPNEVEVLHFSSSCSHFSFSDHDLKRLRSLRSLFIFVDEYKGNMISQISKHVYLRVLRLDGIQVSTLPKSICKLKHLRYLSICKSEIASLPESIMYLQNLQVLLLRWCVRLRKLPEGMRYMKNLRCLDNHGCELDFMPVGMKELSSLRRLSSFVVGKEKGAQLRELGDLNLLGGRIVLERLENVGGLEEAKSANMKEITNLISLVLRWSSSSDQLKSDKEEEEVVEGLEPNLSLKQLEIINYMGTTISPSWMMKLKNLAKIEFIGCRKCEVIPSLGNLPSLRFMNLQCMNVLEHFYDDELPSLQELKIHDCQRLVSLPNDLPKLVNLDIQHAERLVSLPSNLPHLVRFDISYAEGLVRLPSNLPKLEVLDIQHAERLFCLPSNLPNLEMLNIQGAEGLVYLPRNLPKVTSMRIINCPRLYFLPDGLNELTSLTIGGCEHLQRTCEKEKLEGWPNMSRVPDYYTI